MNILNIIPTINAKSGGTAECVRQLFPFMNSQGHRWEVLTFDSPDEDFVKENPFPVHAIGHGHTGFQFHAGLVPWLKAHRSEYDTAIIHGIWTYHSYGAWRALHTHLPYFVYPHGMLDPYFKKAFPLKHLKKHLFWHWGDYRVLRDSTAVCFTCEEEKILARQSFAHYSCREEVVGLGTASPLIDKERQQGAFFDAFPHLKGTPYLLFMSRIHPKKGLDLLLQAAGELKRLRKWQQFHLVIAGPDGVGWRSKLEYLAQQEDLSSHITWTGMLDGDLKWGALQGAEAFILPSHQENFGIVVAEALSCGIPVLISHRVNIWREIDEAGAGFIAPDTKQGTIDLIERWIETPETKRETMRRNASCCFAENFEIEKAASNLLKVITSH
ncbi:MAG TPA: glycosyltransferase [Abditibacterium sp.]|jgi:glycosyltransferase involved in cell wall biosynthesis